MIDKSQKIILAIFGAVILVALIVLIVVVATRDSRIIISEFEAPEFEKNAVVGIPEGVDAYAYREIKIDDNFVFSLCMEPVVENDALNIFFTSHKDNDVWMLIRVYDAKTEEIIGSSGLIRAGEYVEKVTLSDIPSDKSVKVKVLSYEKDTYLSHGAASATVPITFVSE